MENSSEVTPTQSLKALTKKSLPLMGMNTISITGEFISTYLLADQNQSNLGASMLVTAINNFVADSLTMLPNQNTALIAEHFGQLNHNPHDTRTTREENSPLQIGIILRQAWMIGLVAALPGMLVLLPIKPILESLGQSSDTSELVRQYYLPGAFALPLQILLNTNERLAPSVNLENWLIPYKILLTSIGIGFNALLIPRYGMYGAGFALLGKSLAGLAMTTLFIAFKKEFKKFGIFEKALELKKHPYYKKILIQGIPITLAQIGVSGGSFGISLAIGHLGNLRLQIEKVAQQYFGILTTITHGINDAAYRLVGQAMGAENYRLTQRYGNMGLLGSSIGFTVGAIATNAAAIQLASLFMGESAHQNESLIRYTFILASLGKLFGVILEASTLNLAALQDTLLPSLVTVITTLALILPTSIILSYLTNLDIYGVAATIAGGLLLAGSANTAYWITQSNKAVTNSAFCTENDTSNVKFNKLLTSIPFFKKCKEKLKASSSENETLLPQPQ